MNTLEAARHNPITIDTAQTPGADVAPPMNAAGTATTVDTTRMMND
jgi:hypothetical protein